MKNRIVKIIKIVLPAFCLLIWQSCKEKDLAKRYQKVVTSSQSVALYEIDEFPTEKSEQQKAKQYLNDYEIKRTILLDAAQTDSLKKHVSDWSNYDSLNVKSCPFVGKYALFFQEKSSAALVVLGGAPCSRAIWSGSDASFSTKTVELTPSNNIEPLLTKIVSK